MNYGTTAQKNGPKSLLMALHASVIHGCPVWMQMLTRTITCALLNGLGDIFSQLVVEKTTFSVQRTTTFTLLVSARA